MPQAALADSVGPRLIYSGYNGRCVEVYGWNKFDGAVINRWNCHGGTNQQWFFDYPNSNGTFRLRGVDSGKCLTYLTNLGSDLRTIRIEPCDGRAGEQWHFSYFGNSLHLESVDYPGKCLGQFFGGNNGSYLWGQQCKVNDDTQSWYGVPDTGWVSVPNAPMYKISFGGRCMDLLGFSPDPGAPIGQWDCWGGDNQRWFVETFPFDNAGNVMLWNRNSGMCLALGNAPTNSGWPLIQTPCPQSSLESAALWKRTTQVVYAGGQTITSYRFENAWQVGKCAGLDYNTSYSAGNGTRLYAQACAYNRSEQNFIQKW